MQPRGKTVLVTGGGNGIGRCAVQRLLDEGAVVCALDISPGALAALKDEFPLVTTMVCDVSDANGVESAVHTFCKNHGPIDILINSAAIVHNEVIVSLTSGGLIRHAVANWDKVVATNLSGVFYVSSNVIQVMIAERVKGLILNVSSIAASGNAGQSAYSATKAALNALIVTWAKELAPMGIRAAGIAPGFVNTETTMASMSEPVRADWKKKTPARRMAEPGEIVDGLLFVIKNDFYNGRILELDGGLRL